jgi:adenosylhomocysteine nucleosidase
MNNLPVIVILVSADAEWRAVRPRLAGATELTTPYGEAAVRPTPDGRYQLVFIHGGWGKIAAAASAQYAIDRWAPVLLVNLGTCGGFAGDITPGTVLLVDFTLVYDVLEQMGDEEAALAHYATELDLSWLPPRLPQPVMRTLLLSADRDIVAGEIQGLRERYGAVAADWESGAIAFVARRNGVRCLILRAVTDVVSPDGGEAYGDLALFEARTNDVMGRLLDTLPEWLALLPE